MACPTPLGGQVADILRRRTPEHVVIGDRGMRDSLRLLLESNSPLFVQTSGAVPLAFKLLMERAAQAGTIRPDANSADVLHALSSIYSASDGPDWQDRSRRLVRLIMDGLRYGASQSSK
jgi:hypothetical protein